MVQVLRHHAEQLNAVLGVIVCAQVQHASLIDYITAHTRHNLQ
jgi:hypothetical protein